MSESHVMVVHVHVVIDRPFEDVASGIERQLGRFDAEVDDLLAAGGDPEAARARIEAMVGPSGFMLFGKRRHGSMLRIVGEERRAIQYVIGNPLFAVRMTRHDIRASLYAPLQVLLYESKEGKTCLEYDKPSTLFGQFGNTEVTAVATMLDQKLEALVDASLR